MDQPIVKIKRLTDTARLDEGHSDVCAELRAIIMRKKKLRPRTIGQ